MVQVTVQVKSSGSAGGEVTGGQMGPVVTAIACSSGLKCGVNAVEDGFVPAGAEAFAADVLFEGSVLPENVEGKSSEGGSHFRG